jgi:hypothetical protein
MKSIILAVLLLAPSASLDAADLDIVREGKVINLVHPEPGHSYASKNGAVEVRDPRKVFALDAKLGAEFTVKAPLRIDSASQFRDELKTGPLRYFRLDGFVGWVGTYADIKHGCPGQYALRLLPRLGDTGYPGLHQLADGTLVATTYGVLATGEKPSIVSLRFTMSEVDALAAKETSGTK